jgi:DNA-binding transcriptional LysR family regulator
MIDAAAVDHFGSTLRSFRDAHPDIDLHLQVGPSSQMLTSLRSGDIDLAVCVTPPDAALHLTPSHVTPLHITPLLTEPLSIYAPDGKRAGPASGWGPWVTFPSGSLTRELIATELRAAGARFEVVAESHQPEVLREMVQLGLGWTVLPRTQAERAPAPLVRARAAPLLHRQLVAVRRTSAAPDPAAEALVGTLVAVSARG